MIVGIKVGIKQLISLMLIFVVIALVGCGKSYESELGDKLNQVCNNLVQNNNVYPQLVNATIVLEETTGYSFMTYSYPGEVRSGKDVLEETGKVFCRVPVELCYDLNSKFETAYCDKGLIELKVDVMQWQEWRQEKVQ